MLFLVRITIFLVAHLLTHCYCIYWWLMIMFTDLWLTTLTTSLYQPSYSAWNLLLSFYSIQHYLPPRETSNQCWLIAQLLPCFRGYPTPLPRAQLRAPGCGWFECVGKGLLPWSGLVCGVAWCLIIHWKPLQCYSRLLTKVVCQFFLILSLIC